MGTRAAAAIEGGCRARYQTESLGDDNMELSYAPAHGTGRRAGPSFIGVRHGTSSSTWRSARYVIANTQFVAWLEIEAIEILLYISGDILQATCHAPALWCPTPSHIMCDSNIINQWVSVNEQSPRVLLKTIRTPNLCQCYVV
jgi:hypothetical protein